MKLFNKDEEKRSVGRPRLADTKLKKKSVIMSAVSLLLVIILLSGCLVSFNIIPRFNKLKGAVNVNLCSEIPAKYQPKSESNPEGKYDYGFTDPKFYSAVLSNGYVGEYSNYPYNNSNYCNTITEEQLQSITSLSIDSRNIDTADGVQYLIGLTNLSLDGSSISNPGSGNLTSIDVSHNSELINLSLGHNKISSIDVSKNVKLTKLSLSSNNLTSLDLSNNTALTELSLYFNNLVSIDVSKNTALKYLYLTRNNLNSIDVNENINLSYLDVGNNNLTSIDVSQNTGLGTLDVGNNNLTSIDVSQNTGLGTLDVGNNNLTSIDVSQNTGLHTLWLNNNNLTSIDLSQNMKLYALYLSDNKLTNIDLSHNPELTTLSMLNNNLSNIDLSNNSKIKNLILDTNAFNRTYYTIDDSITVEQSITTAYPNNILSTVDASIATYNNDIVKRLKPGVTAMVIRYKVSDSCVLLASYLFNFIGVTSDHYLIDYENNQIDLKGEILSNISYQKFLVSPSDYSLIINNDKLNIKDGNGNIVDTYIFKNYSLYKLTSSYYTIDEKNKTIDLKGEILSSYNNWKFSINPSGYSLNMNKNKLEIKDSGGNVVETYKFINYLTYKLNSSHYMIDNNNKTIDVNNNIFNKDKIWMSSSDLYGLYEMNVNKNRLEILDSDKNVVDSYEIINEREKVEDAYIKSGFKDKNLYTCIVREYFKVDEIEGNYLLTNEEMQNIGYLYCPNQNVSDSTGIEKLINLTDLDLSYNNIETINLKNNINLSNLILLNNKLTNLDLTNNVSLQTIAIANNNISKIKGLDSLESLFVLYTPNNNLSDLNLSKLSGLQLIAVDNNVISKPLYMLNGKEIDYKKDIKLNNKYEINYDIVDTGVAVYEDSKLKALKEGITNIYLSNENIISYQSDLYNKIFKCQYLQDEKICLEVENIQDKDVILPYFLSQEIKVYDITSKEYKIDKDKKTIDALNKDFDASKINLTLNGLTGTLEDDKFIIKDKDVIVDTYTVTNIKKVIKEEVVSDSSNGTKEKPENKEEANEKVINKIAKRNEEALKDVKLEDIIIEGENVPLATLLLVKGKDRNIVVKNEGITVTINGKDIEKIEGNLDLSYELKVLKESIIYNEVKDKVKEGMVLSFKGNNLPGKVLISVDVTNTIKKNAGTKNLRLYGYKNGELTLVAENINPKDKKLSFYVKELGSYVLTDKELTGKSIKKDTKLLESNTKINKGISFRCILWLLLILIILGIIGYLIYKKNKDKND